MISTGACPSRLKCSEIQPLFKKCDKTKTSNFRPISLLTNFSKIFEKIIYRRLYHHINFNHILVNEQFGFRNNSSTEIASCKLISDILFVNK
jgi:hypothetical protein